MRNFSLMAAAFCAILFGSLTVSVHAQGWPPPPGGPGHGPAFGGPGGPGGHRGGLEHLITDLKLTPAQVAKIKPIFEASRAKMDALRANTSLSPQTMFAKFQQMHAWQTAKISVYLTPSQRTKFAALEARRKMHGWGGPGGPSGPGGPGGPGGRPDGPGGPGNRGRPQP